MAAVERLIAGWERRTGKRWGFVATRHVGDGVHLEAHMRRGVFTVRVLCEDEPPSELASLWHRSIAIILQSGEVEQRWRGCAVDERRLEEILAFVAGKARQELKERGHHD